MLGTQTRGGRMEGADKTTELWRHPINRNVLIVFTDSLSSLIFCWLGHLRMSFYYPTSHQLAKGVVYFLYITMWSYLSQTFFVMWWRSWDTITVIVTIIVIVNWCKVRKKCTFESNRYVLLVYYTDIISGGVQKSYYISSTIHLVPKMRVYYLLTS